MSWHRSRVLLTHKIDSTQSAITEKKYQAQAQKTQPFGKESFSPFKTTRIRWLGMAGLINSRDTTMSVDPLSKGFDMPIMIDFPIKTEDVSKLDAILVTLSDNDHYSISHKSRFKKLTKAYHSTYHVDSLMKSTGLPSFGHNPGDEFKVGPVNEFDVLVPGEPYLPKKKSQSKK